MKEITLEGGIKVRTFRPRPLEGFDPLTASRADLARFGFPPRPDDPHHLARYTRVWGQLKNKFRYVEPTFRVDKEKIWGPRRRAEGFGTEQSTNWSGGVVYAPSGKMFKWLQGDWVIPDAYAPTQSGWYYCGTWIGIDGDGSDDVFQAGIGFDVSRSVDIVRNIYPWWEWWPAPPVNITNFPIGPGDMVTALLHATGSKPYTAGTLTFTNRTNGASTSVNLTAPAGKTLVGNCAEWIVEAPGAPGVPTLPLADYGEVFFSVCEAVTEDGTTVNGGTGSNINMVVGGNVVSDGNLITPTIIQCLYAGPEPSA